MPDLPFDIRVAGDRQSEWSEASIHYWLLEGDAYLEQGVHQVRCDALLLWSDETTPDRKEFRVLGAGNVRIDGAGRKTQKQSDYSDTLRTKNNFVVLPSKQRSTSPVDSHPLVVRAKRLQAIEADAAKSRTRDTMAAEGAVVSAALVEPTALDAPVQTVQAVVDTPPGVLPPPSLEAGPPQPSAAPPPSANPFATPGLSPGAGSGPRRIRWYPRTSAPFNIGYSLTPTGERQIVFTGGINILIDEVETGNTVDIVADRAVLWIQGDASGDPNIGGLVVSGVQRSEAYLEGNVYIRQGNPSKLSDPNSVVLFGKQVYFNVQSNQSLVLDGAVETFEPRLQAPLYMTSEEIRQLAPGEFYGKNAAFTTSVHRGTPGYAFQGREVYFEEIRQRITNPFTGAEVINPETGQPVEVNRHYATGYGNFLRLNNVPVFYWPYLRANAEDPLGPIEDIRIGHTNNLGTNAALVLDVWQLFGLDYLPAADSSNWLLDLGYFSKRGFAPGSRFNYFGEGLFTQDDRYWGNSQLWYIHDDGLDQLGPGRLNIVPSTPNRGRAHFQHRHDFTPGTYVIGEVSYLSDSNLLESFFEPEYDSGKDQDTLLYGKHSRENWAVTGLIQPRLREFLPQNDWLPRADFLWLGQPLFGDRLTYITRSSLGYGGLNQPSNYTLPGEQQIDLGRLDTRHELDLPLSLGPWEVTPFVVGQFSGYTDTPIDDPIGRLYGAAGVRTSLPFYRIYPNVRSDLFYLNGIAHKVSLNADYLFARSSEPFQDLPLMDQLDDDTSDLVRRQNLLREFGGIVPLQYDPRFIALRRGLTYYPEALDDMDQFRFSITNRLQTKRGPIQNQRIIDWMYLDIGASAFPNSERDNLDKTFGLISSKYRWHVGDRTLIQSNLLYEPFDDALQVGSGITLQRPPRGTLSLTFSHFDSGPFQSYYIGGGSAYRFSQRYAGAIEIGKDLEADNTFSCRAGFSRIGLDFVTTLGIVWNAGRDDFGVDFSILPRVAARSTFGRGSLNTLPFGVEPAGTIAPASLDRLAIINGANGF